MITSQDYQRIAEALHVEVAALKAVAEVESGGDGMTTINGNVQPVILFEPHVFWRELKKRGIEPAHNLKGNEDILYEKWGAKPYPHGQLLRWMQLDKAAKINRDAALSSASYGKFQIMGFNYSSCGCKNVQEFVNAMYKGDAEHLRLFGNYIQSAGLLRHLQHRDWVSFARGYNGAGYAQNNYHKKLNTAYLKYAGALN